MCVRQTLSQTSDYNFQSLTNMSTFLNPIITSFSMEIDGVASPHWRRGLKLQLVSIAYWVCQTSTRGYADSYNNIHPKHPSSHRLCAGEIMSIKSPIMSCNVAWSAPLLEKNSLFLNSFIKPYLIIPRT